MPWPQRPASHEHSQVVVSQPLFGGLQEIPAEARMKEKREKKEKEMKENEKIRYDKTLDQMNPKESEIEK